MKENRIGGQIRLTIFHALQGDRGQMPRESWPGPPPQYGRPQMIDVSILPKLNQLLGA